MKKLNLLLALALMLLILSCNKKDKFDILTERIQYDVPIKNTDVDDRWWVDNIVGPDREDLVKGIFEKASNGELKVYDYFNEILTPDDVKKIGIDTLYKRIKSTSPPYEEYDTMIVTSLDLSDITKLRFLEEWKIDRKTLDIHKRVIGIAPIKMVEMGGNLYTMPLFWFYLDENYPAVLKN